MSRAVKGKDLLLSTPRSISRHNTNLEIDDRSRCTLCDGLGVVIYDFSKTIGVNPHPEPGDNVIIHLSSIHWGFLFIASAAQALQ